MKRNYTQTAEAILADINTLKRQINALNEAVLPQLWNYSFNDKGERVYPIYAITVNFSKKGKWTEENRKEREGLPEGRVWDAATVRFMRKDRFPIDVGLKVFRSWFQTLVDNSLKDENEERHIVEPGDIAIYAQYLEHDTWCPGWFSHYTYNTEQTDEQALRSFGRYVNRMRMREQLYKKEARSYLMGAEERWRWGGEKQRETGTVVCRCEDCIKQGVIRIDH